VRASEVLIAVAASAMFTGLLLAVTLSPWIAAWVVGSGVLAFGAAGLFQRRERPR
jgi:quinol-cytochrome oxidoreductase complex cytochrome b subunit